jgi:hypothetical protein
MAEKKRVDFDLTTSSVEELIRSHLPSTRALCSGLRPQTPSWLYLASSLTLFLFVGSWMWGLSTARKPDASVSRYQYFLYLAAQFCLAMACTIIGVSNLLYHALLAPRPKRFASDQSRDLDLLGHDILEAAVQLHMTNGTKSAHKLDTREKVLKSFEDYNRRVLRLHVKQNPWHEDPFGSPKSKPE